MAVDVTLSVPQDMMQLAHKVATDAKVSAAIIMATPSIMTKILKMVRTHAAPILRITRAFKERIMALFPIQT
jgi:hypothetical protein